MSRPIPIRVRMTSELRFAVRWLAHLGTLALLLCLTACSTPGRGPTEPELPPSSGYLRTLRTGDRKAQLQVAIRRFTPNGRRGTPVWLIGVCHVGDPAYYATLQRTLDEQALVLYEGVKVAEREASGKPAPVVEDDARDAALKSSLQGTMAEALGLVFQLSAIHYNRPHFRNSDLSLPELEKLVNNQQANTQEDQSSAHEAGLEFAMLKQALEGGSLLNELAKIVLGLIQSSPKLQGLAKLALIEVTGAAGDNLESLSQLSPGMKSLLHVLVDARNQKVLKDLRKSLRQPANSRGIAIFYGAAHMRDFEHRLATELGYYPREERWLTAVELDLAAAGIGPFEERLLRSVIDWDQLK